MNEVQRAGMNIETISTLMFALTPLSILIFFIFGKLTKPGNEMSEVVAGLYWKFIGTGAALLSLFLVINVFSNYYIKIVLIVTSEIISLIVEARISISLGAFFIRIADKEIGGTYITTLAAVTSLGILYLESVILFLSDYMTIYIMTFGGWIFALFYIKWIKKKLLRLQELDESAFKLC